MPSRSKSRPGHRPHQRPHRHSRNRLGTASTVRQGDFATNLLSIAAVSGQTTQKLLTFDAPVIPRTSGAVPSTDFQLTCSGETTRTLSSWIAVGPNTVKAVISGALTAAKTYVGTLAVGCGSLVVFPNRQGTRIANIVT